MVVSFYQVIYQFIICRYLFFSQYFTEKKNAMTILHVFLQWHFLQSIDHVLRKQFTIFWATTWLLVLIYFECMFSDCWAQFVILFVFFWGWKLRNMDVILAGMIFKYLVWDILEFIFSITIDFSAYFIKWKLSPLVCGDFLNELATFTFIISGNI